jgi:hypothetical protein
MPTVELLFFEGCPSRERLLPVVRRLADEAGAPVIRAANGRRVA